MSELITITVKTERELKLPALPNFLRDENGNTVAIATLSQEQLQEVGEAWTMALKRKARDAEG